MFNLSVNPTLSRGLLSELFQDLDSEITKHLAINPRFDSHAAGRDFATHGEALDLVFSALHSRNLDLMRRAAEVSSAAHREVTVISEADSTSAADLTEVEAQAWEK